MGGPKKKKGKEKEAYAVEEGPSRGFSLKGWKESLPRKRATQETEFLGQLLIYMVITNITMLATTNTGINQGNHFLKCLISLYSGSGWGPEVVVGEEEETGGVWPPTGWTVLPPRRECMLIWTSDCGGGPPSPPAIRIKHQIKTQNGLSKWIMVVVM